MISDYYSDDELISQFRMFFDNEEDIDYYSYLGQIEEVDDQTLQVQIKDKTLQIDKTLCNVTEVET